MSGKRIIFSGGGTAGHLFPALAVARKIREAAPDTAITFVGGTRALEKRLMDHYQADFIPLNIEGLKGRGIKSLKSLLLLPFAFVNSLTILIRKRPHLVIGVGGFSSGPIVLLASWLRIPTLIMEQNLHPGFTNRMLIPWVKQAVVAFEESLVHFKRKARFIGNPVREEFYSISPKTHGEILTVFIFGGSQGSRILNRVATDALPMLESVRERLQFIHQTGESDLSWVRERYADAGFLDSVIEPFLFNMPEYFQRSDLIVCRAGATTIAELIAARRAAILIPFALAADNHQVLNARELEKHAAAEVILEEEFTPSLYARKMHYFVSNIPAVSKMEENLAALQPEKPAEKISDLCFELMKMRPKEDLIG